jgi:hypothetical protein
MSIRIVPAILAAVAFSLTSANAQPAKPQPPNRSVSMCSTVESLPHQMSTITALR